MAKSTWLVVDKSNWHASLDGEALPARIRQLDAKTFAVYRSGRYLGCESTLSTAQERAVLNVRSEINREMDWQRAHPDEQPLGLRLTPQERDAGWQAKPPRAARIAVPPVAEAGGPRKVLGNHVSAADVDAFAAAGPNKAKPVPRAKTSAGSKDAEIRALLLRGCTSEEVLRVTGWTAISMPAMAKKLGLALRIDKGRKPFRYHGEEK